MPPRPVRPLDFTVLETLGFVRTGPGRVQLLDKQAGATLGAELAVILRPDLRPPPRRQVRAAAAPAQLDASVMVTLPSGEAAVGISRVLTQPNDILPLIAELLAQLRVTGFDRFAPFHPARAGAAGPQLTAARPQAGRTHTRLVRVDSENLAQLGYDRASKILEVVFADRPTTLYRYSDVPAKTFLNLLRAASLGRYFAAHIRLKYKFVTQELPPP